MEVREKIEAAVSSKGQVTIPKRIRKLLHTEYGNKVVFVMFDNGTVELNNPKNFTSEEDVKRQLKEYHEKYGIVELAEEDNFLNDFVGDWE